MSKATGEWPEDCYRRCGSDKIWQTVPDTCSGDWESSVTDGKESCATDNQRWRCTGTESLRSLDICHMKKHVNKVCRCGPIISITECELMSVKPFLVVWRHRNIHQDSELTDADFQTWHVWHSRHQLEPSSLDCVTSIYAVNTLTVPLLSSYQNDSKTLCPTVN